MYFYVFIQPEVFEEAQYDGEDAVINIASILGGFLQNCFLSVFEDDHWGEAVKEKLNEWPETDMRKRIKTLLSQLKKRKRILYNITPDYAGIISDLDSVFDQASSIPLDLLLIIEKEIHYSSQQGVEVTTRRRYQLTSFETKRSDLAVDGKTCIKGEMGEFDFMQFHFGRALRNATFIHICDRVCGIKNFAGNFGYTTKCLLRWLGDTLIDPINCNIIFHMGQPVGKGAQHVLNEISSFKKGPLSKTRIEIIFYNTDNSLPDPTLPHQRFFLTDQIALDIDRGLDFLDRKTKRCRDTYVNYQKREDANRLLQSYSTARGSSYLI